MKHFHYISDILVNENSKEKLKDIVSSKIFLLLTQNNNYPLIEHDKKHDLFVLTIPSYNTKQKAIDLIECNILIADRDVYIITNHTEPFIDTIIEKIQHKRIEYDSTIYSLILAFNNHILDTIQQLEHVIEHFKVITTSTHGYTEHVIQDIMRFKLTIGMFKSTIGPLAEIIEQFFEIVTHPDEETKSMRTTHIAYMLKQISSQTHYLYENISVIADTSNAIQNIRANNIMKTLTMISSIFIPLSFITWVFGMNFVDLPTENTTIYIITISVMIFIWLVQFYVFKRKKWF